MRVRWGVLGTANIANGCTIPGMKKASNCKLYAIAGRNEDKVNFFKEKFGFKKGYVGYDELLADPKVEAVYIPLPNGLHKEWVIKALKAGKHVLCEKPLALNVEEAEEMFAVARENNVILMEAYAYLHSPYVEALRRDVAAGVIGDVLYMDTAFVTQGYKEDIRLYKDLGGGGLYDLGCYCTTMILKLLSNPEVEYVKSVGELTDQGVDRFAGGIIKFKTGTRASLNVGMILGEDTNMRYDHLYIRGTKGMIHSDVEFNQEGRLSYRITVDGKETVRRVKAPHNYALEIEQMGKAIRGEEPAVITAEFSLANARILDALLAGAGY